MLLTQQSVRLLTLTGPGGAGKTRLAIETGQSLMDEYLHGVYFVPLAPVDDPGRVLPAVAQALGLRENLDGPADRRLAQHLAGQQALLVLDTFEHLRAAAPEIGRLLAACEQVTIMVTSRSPLHLGGEHLYPVRPLPTQHEATADELEQTEATALFIQRARAANPAFVVSNDTASVIAQICARLDGLPLALELAAARATILSPCALLRRLDRSLSLLTGGPVDAPPRHQTLRSAIDWSYRLLAAEERALFARLSALSDSWTLEMAEAVCCPEERADLLPRVARLVDASLLQVADDEEPRFAMLHTIREYAAEKLREDCDW